MVHLPVTNPCLVYSGTPWVLTRGRAQILVCSQNLSASANTVDLPLQVEERVGHSVSLICLWMNMQGNVPP